MLSELETQLHTPKNLVVSQALAFGADSGSFATVSSQLGNQAGQEEA